MTDEEKRLWYLEYVEQTWAGYLASYPGTERPEVSFVRFVPFAEVPEQTASCYQSFGIAASFNEMEGSVRFRGLSEQMAATDLIGFRCEGMYPPDPVSQLELNESQYRYLFWYHTVSLPECLAQLGVEIHEFPTYETFRELDQSGHPWSALSGTESLPNAEEISRTCRVVPVGLYG